MFLPMPPRRRTPEKPDGFLPAPGPYPVAKPSLHSIVIFVIIIVTVAWLLAQGYSINATLEVIGGAGALTAALVPCLAGTPSVAR